MRGRAREAPKGPWETEGNQGGSKEAPRAAWGARGAAKGAQGEAKGRTREARGGPREPRHALTRHLRSQLGPPGVRGKQLKTGGCRDEPRI